MEFTAIDIIEILDEEKFAELIKSLKDKDDTK